MSSGNFLAFEPGAVAVVTGAAAGIGRATADLLLSAGIAVSGWDLSAPGIAEFAGSAEAHGGRAIGLTVDVTDRDAVDRAFADTESRLGPVGHLVNNAGPASGTPLPFLDGLAASVGSVELVTSVWLSTAGSVGGHLVNISSVAGSIIGVGATDWYPAGKAGITGYTRHLALTRPQGIRANAVAPGMTATARTRDGMQAPEAQEIIARNPFRRPAEPADIAAAVVFLLAPVSAYINGVLLPVDGGSLMTQ